MLLQRIEICVFRVADLCYLLCDASLDPRIASKHLLHTVDNAAFSHIRET